MHGELFANSRMIRCNSRVVPGGHGLKERRLLSLSDLLAEVEVKGMREMWLVCVAFFFFLFNKTLDTVASAVFVGLVQQLIKFQTGVFCMAV